jgi:hypothetical protein
MEKLAPIAHENALVKFAAIHFVAQGLNGRDLLDKIEFQTAVADVPSFRHALGSLDDDFYKKHIVGNVKARIIQAQQCLTGLKEVQAKVELRLAKWAAVKKSLERDHGHPLPEKKSSSKRGSSESAPETSKKARLDSAVTLPSSPENSRPFSGTATRPTCSKVSDYNVKAKFHAILDAHIGDDAGVRKHPTKSGKAPVLRPANVIVGTCEDLSQADELNASSV